MLTKALFEKLFKENYSRLYRIVWGYFANNELADEIVSETFIKLWNSRETLKIEFSCEDYLTRILINTCVDYYRKERIRKEKTIHIDENVIVCTSLADLDQDPLDYVVTREQEAIIEKAIKELPARYRETFSLIKIEGLSYEEAAGKMKVSKNTVKSNLKDATNILKEKLEKRIVCILLIVNIISQFC